MSDAHLRGCAPDLEVNLHDPQDVLAKIPVAQRRAAALRERAEAKKAEADWWDRMIFWMEGQALEGPADA